MGCLFYFLIYELLVSWCKHNSSDLKPVWLIFFNYDHLPNVPFKQLVCPNTFLYLPDR